MAVPHAEGAPCLGGHNRGELPPDIATPEAAAAYLETLSSQPVHSHRYHYSFCQRLQSLIVLNIMRRQEAHSCTGMYGMAWQLIGVSLPR